MTYIFDFVFENSFAVSSQKISKIKAHFNSHEPVLENQNGFLFEKGKTKVNHACNIGWYHDQ